MACQSIQQFYSSRALLPSSSSHSNADRYIISNEGRTACRYLNIKKWQWNFDREQLTMWLNCEMDKQDKGLINLVGGHTFVQ